MKKSTKLLTTAEFAKLHDVNKRTLHYYDSIGLFSPAKKGENQYRYYEMCIRDSDYSLQLLNPAMQGHLKAFHKVPLCLPKQCQGSKGKSVLRKLHFRRR